MLFAAFQAVNLARYPETPDWDTTQAWAYAAALVGLFALGAVGLWRSSGARA